MRLEARSQLVLLTIAFAVLVGLAPQSASSAESCGRAVPDRTLSASEDESGIGGTGIRGVRPESEQLAGDDSESGIGGTGIFGTVTDLDRLCVNGLAIQASSQMLAQSSNGVADEGALAVGMVVWIRASQSEDGLIAEQIRIDPGVAGEIMAVSSDGRAFVIAGQTIALASGVSRGPGVDDDAPRPGQWRVVHGLRDEKGRLIASRIEVGQEGLSRGGSSSMLAQWLNESGPLHTLSIEGYVSGSPERPRLAGLEVEVSAGHPEALPGTLRPGLRVTAEGTLSSKGVFHIERSAIHTRPPRDGSIDRPVPAPPNTTPGGVNGNERPTTPQSEHPPGTNADRPHHEELERRPHRPSVPPPPPRIDRPRIRPTIDRPTRREIDRLR